LNSNAFNEVLPFFQHEVLHKAYFWLISHAKNVTAAADGCAERPEGQLHVDPQDQQLQPSKHQDNGVLHKKKMPHAHKPLFFKVSW